MLSHLLLFPSLSLCLQYPTVWGPPHAAAMNATSPKSSLVKLGLHTNKQKTLKVMVLGQSGVGKTGERHL